MDLLPDILTIHVPFVTTVQLSGKSCVSVALVPIFTFFHLYITYDNCSSTNKNIVTYCGFDGVVCCSNSNILKTTKVFANTRSVDLYRMTVIDYLSAPNILMQYTDI